MKKFLKVGLFVLVMLSVASMAFAGGGGGDQSGRTVVRLGIYPEADQPSEVAMHQEFIRRFNERWPDVVIQPAQYRYQVDTFMPLVQAGRVPTIFETWFTETQKLITGGHVRDITNQVRSRGWDAKMNPGIRDLMSRGGRIYGIPRDGYILGLHINADLFRQAGLVDANGIPRYPRTMAELATTAAQIRQRTGQAGICLLAKDNAGGWHFSNIAWNFGATFMVERGGRLVPTVNTNEAVEALQWVMDLRWVHNALTADPTNEDWGTGWRAIGTGTAAMYIGAADGVNQPTEVWGMPVQHYMIAPMPAGPRGHQFSLMGGTPYMFARNASDAEVEAAINYLEIMGRTPDVTSDVRIGLMRDARRRRDAGIPVIPDFPAWICPDYNAARQEAIDMFSNVDQRMFADYFAIIQRPGNVRAEYPELVQELYAELTKALQAVITDRNANPRALLNEAQRNMETLFAQSR